MAVTALPLGPPYTRQEAPGGREGHKEGAEPAEAAWRACSMRTRAQAAGDADGTLLGAASPEAIIEKDHHGECDEAANDEQPGWPGIRIPPRARVSRPTVRNDPHDGSNRPTHEKTSRSLCVRTRQRKSGLPDRLLTIQCTLRPRGHETGKTLGRGEDTPTHVLIQLVSGC